MDDFSWEFLEKVNKLNIDFQRKHSVYPNTCIVDRATFQILSVDNIVKRVYSMDLLVIDKDEEYIGVGYFYG